MGIILQIDLRGMIHCPKAGDRGRWKVIKTDRGRVVCPACKLRSARYYSDTENEQASNLSRRLEAWTLLRFED